MLFIKENRVLVWNSEFLSLAIGEIFAEMPKKESFHVKNVKSRCPFSHMP